MTEEQRAKRIFDIVYSTDSRTELAEQIVNLEDVPCPAPDRHKRVRTLVNVLSLMTGVGLGIAIQQHLERNIPYSYRQTLPDIVSYILTGDLAPFSFE